MRDCAVFLLELAVRAGTAATRRSNRPGPIQAEPGCGIFATATGCRLGDQNPLRDHAPDARPIDHSLDDELYSNRNRPIFRSFSPRFAGNTCQSNIDRAFALHDLFHYGACLVEDRQSGPATLYGQADQQ